MRWSGIITYLTNNGPLSAEYSFDEIEDLHDIVERGPNFYTIESIVVKLKDRTPDTE